MTKFFTEAFTWKGNRTYFLAVGITIAYFVAVFTVVDDIVEALEQLPYIIGALGALLGASKLGTAQKMKAQNGHGVGPGD